VLINNIPLLHFRHPLPGTRECITSSFSICQ